MSDNVRYFEVVGERLIVIAEEYFATLRNVYKRRREYLKSIGAKQYYGTTRYVTGVVTNSPPSDGWRKTRGADEDVIVPDQRRKAGRDARAKLQSLTLPLPSAFNKAIKARDEIFPEHGQGVLRSVQLGRLREHICCIVPKTKGWRKPTGLRELKEWQYLKIVDENKNK